MKSNRNLVSYLVQFFLVREMFQTNIVEEIKTRCMLNDFFPTLLPCMRLCGKIWYKHTCHKWQYNTALALCMPEN